MRCAILTVPNHKQKLNGRGEKLLNQRARNFCWMSRSFIVSASVNSRGLLKVNPNVSKYYTHVYSRDENVYVALRSRPNNSI
jgi:hypothetical protein